MYIKQFTESILHLDLQTPSTCSLKKLRACEDFVSFCLIINVFVFFYVKSWVNLLDPKMNCTNKIIEGLINYHSYEDDFQSSIILNNRHLLEMLPSLSLNYHLANGFAKI